MDFTAVDDYLHKLQYTDHYTELELAVREKMVFTAEEMLMNHYDEKFITYKAVALQTGYMIEGEAEEFAKFKRQGVKSLGLSGMSFSFEGTNIAPDVVSLIEKEKSKQSRSSGVIGRLI